MRRFDSDGLDGPWMAYHGSVCVTSGSSYDIEPLGSTPLSADIDDFKMVIWWYDSGFNDGSTLDDADLYLYDDTGGATLLRTSGAVADNREMVYYTGIGGPTIRAHISATATSDDQGCGTNGLRVYFAMYAEDGDREMAENLDDIERM